MNVNNIIFIAFFVLVEITFPLPVEGFYSNSNDETRTDQLFARRDMMENTALTTMPKHYFQPERMLTEKTLR